MTSGGPSHPEQALSDPGESNRLELLKFSYAEVLDATKHQDDKISRLLTPIAFLTAASLALAGLELGKGARGPLTQPYELDGVSVPLAGVTTAFYLLWTLATVVMLLASLTTALRVPGPLGSGRARTKPVKASPIYFHQIAALSLDEWQDKITSATTQTYTNSLVKEVHNLAVRTEFKYIRTGEAVAVFTFSLYNLALSIALVFGQVVLGLPSSTQYVLWVFAILTAFYVWFIFMSSLRESKVTVEAIALPRHRKLFLLPPLIASIPILVVWAPSWNWRISTAVLVIAIGGFIALARRWSIDESDGRLPVERTLYVGVAVLVTGLILAVLQLQALSLALCYLIAFLLSILPLIYAGQARRRWAADWRNSTQAVPIDHTAEHKRPGDSSAHPS